MKYCIFTIIKDEQDYLDEWIQYHLNLGINHILIYEDIFSKSHKEICDKYDNVELFSILDIYKDSQEKRDIIRGKLSHKFLQKIYMKKILLYIKDNYNFDWVFYIDVDEFLTFENNSYNFDNIFSQFMDKQIVVMYWQNYNANGHIYKQKGKCVNIYTNKCFVNEVNCTKQAFNMNLFNKTVKFSHHRPINAIWCRTNGDHNKTWEKEKIQEHLDKEDFCYDKIYIRHYFTKSLEEFIYKLFIRGDFKPNCRKIDDFFKCNPEIDKNSTEVKKLMDKYSKFIYK